MTQGKIIKHRENSGKTQGISSQLEHGHPENAFQEDAYQPLIDRMLGSASGGGARGGVWSRGVASQHALRQTPPPVNRMTNSSKNITLATTSLRPVKTPFMNHFANEILHFWTFC